VRAVVTGAAGFVGSHLATRLTIDGWDVVGIDNLVTGRAENLAHLGDVAAFSFEERDTSDRWTVDGPVDLVLHFASPASPPDYLARPLETLHAGSTGTERVLDLALDKGARIVLASTSEVYGDPLVHPQPEAYWGNVNPVGPRSVYDEAKRYAEALAMAYHRVHGLAVGLARIFNTYGPRMRRDDGRAVPNFVVQAIHGDPITVHGDGEQTRSLCYVDDLVEGVVRLASSDHVGPMNLGNPYEVTVLELATMIRDLAGSSSPITFVERPADDPSRRKPDIDLATSTLGWRPDVPLRDGLERTLAWASARW
jgi:nucleoside-diphosphate-sugar epimerase